MRSVSGIGGVDWGSAGKWSEKIRGVCGDFSRDGCLAITYNNTREAIGGSCSRQARFWWRDPRDGALLEGGSAMKPYDREISRAHKGCILFLLDQSFSMEEPIGGSRGRKCDELVLAINRLLNELVIKATRDKGIQDYLDVAVIGYRTDPDANPIIEPALMGALAGRPMVSITDIHDHPGRMDTVTKRIPDEETGEILETQVEVPVWVEAKAEGGTPMLTAMHYLYGLVDEWISKHMDSFPPIVIHISDGESSEGDPVPYADPLRSLATNYGGTLLFNCHLSMTAADPFMFPSSDELLPDPLARVLFRMSSELPGPFYQAALNEGFSLQERARGMAFNADLISLIHFLDIGTRVAKQLR